MKKIMGILLSGIIIILAGCTTASPVEDVTPHYQSYKDIPGVTQEDINAVEKLLTEKPTLIYGFPLSTEAFYEDDGTIV